MPSAHLSTLWVEEDAASLRCLACLGPFDNTALVRTFIVQDSDANSGADREYSKLINTPSGRRILFFDRHFECLLNSGVPFVTVSHVWNPDISTTQNRGRHALISQDVANLAFRTPISIYHGFLQSFGAQGEKYEFWHDYYSVPQWTNELKSNILLIIHKLFNRAHLVIVSLNDVSPSSVDKLYHGTTQKERLEGLVDVVSAKWFSRMWTAMELIQSNTVKTMISDSRLANTTDDDPVFLKRLRQVWDQELSTFSDIHAFQLTYNLHSVRGIIPVQGPLLKLKELKRTCFALGYVTLSYRGCRDRMDFLHGLRGVVIGRTEDPRPDTTFWEQVNQVAYGCLRAGDFSPLLMTPVIEQEDPRLNPDEKDWMNTSYYDVWTWELREEVQPAILTREVCIDEMKGMISAELQVMGVVSTIRNPRGRSGWWNGFPDLGVAAKMVLEASGPDLESFVAGLGTRLYGEETDFIMEHLKENGHIEKLQKNLDARHGKDEPWEVDGENGTEWLADAMTLSRPVKGLSESRIAGLLGRFGTMHIYPYDPFLGITCPGCQKTNFFRAASFVAQEKLLGARAFRIPGLQYLESLRSGMALIVKDDRVIGRMMWATPACACNEMETVNMRMPRLLPPKGQPPRIFRAYSDLKAYS